MLLRVKKNKVIIFKKKSLTSVNNNTKNKQLYMTAVLFLIPHPGQQLAKCSSTCF